MTVTVVEFLKQFCIVLNHGGWLRNNNPTPIEALYENNMRGVTISHHHITIFPQRCEMFIILENGLFVCFNRAWTFLFEEVI